MCLGGSRLHRGGYGGDTSIDPTADVHRHTPNEPYYDDASIASSMVWSRSGGSRQTRAGNASEPTYSRSLEPSLCLRMSSATNARDGFDVVDLDADDAQVYTLAQPKTPQGKRPAAAASNEQRHSTSDDCDTYAVPHAKLCQTTPKHFGDRIDSDSGDYDVMTTYSAGTPTGSVYAVASAGHNASPMLSVTTNGVANLHTLRQTLPRRHARGTDAALPVAGGHVTPTEEHTAALHEHAIVAQSNLSIRHPSDGRLEISKASNGDLRQPNMHRMSSDEADA